jgi:CBS domain-containing protein
MREPSVRECMSQGVIACEPDAALEEVAKIMRACQISAVVVVQQGAAVGVISKTDLVNASFVQPYMRYWRGMTVRHLMSAPVVSIGPDAPLKDALRLLQARRIHRLVVTKPTADGERPVGILSLTDVVRRLGGEPSPVEENP